MNRTEWRPIETAPKDFVTDVDLWAHGQRYTDCSWMRPTYGPKEYVWCRHAYDDCNGPVFNEVKHATHWMPKPAPPDALENGPADLADANSESSLTRDEAMAVLREKEERVRALEADKARLDFLDACNAALNGRYGTNYGWSLVLTHNVTRLMLGRSMEVDLHDSEGGKTKLPSCRNAIDREMARIDVERRARSIPTPVSREQRGEEA